MDFVARFNDAVNTMDSEAIRVAALALIMDAAERHDIVEAAKIHLILGPNGWEINTMTMNVHWPAAGQGDSRNDDCTHGKGLDAECAALVKASSHIALPSPRQLVTLLTEAGAV